MAISFSDSLKKAMATTSSLTNNDVVAVTPAIANVASYSLDEELIAAYPGEETYVRNTNYLWYDDYSDDNISIIDEKKNITVNQDQINLTQEANSQFIPFRMSRYYDGFDLVKTTIVIHFVNKNNYEDYDSPVNVSYSDNYIKFAWLVDERATAVAGKLKFEIKAMGNNSKGDNYIFCTKPCEDGLNILESLAGNGVIEPDSTWITSFMTQITEQVGLAQSYAQDARNAVDEISAYADRASASATEVQNVVDTAKSELETSVETTVNEKVTSALSNYYTTEQVDELLANIDISDQLDEVKQQIADINTRIDNIDGLATFDVEYESTTYTLTFYNGEAVMKKIVLNSDPSAEWVTAYDAKVDSKISAAMDPVKEDLDTYKTTTNTDLEAIHSEIDGLPETLKNDYYNKQVIDSLLENKVDDADIAAINVNVEKIKSTTETNKSNISTLSTKLGNLEDAINGIDSSPQLKYRASYDENFIFTLNEIEGEGTEHETQTPVSKFKIQGGGGGSSTSSVLKIEYITTTPITATVNDQVIIKFNFSGTDSSGDIVPEGTATWRVGSTVVATNTVIVGENSFDVTNFLSIGTQKVMLSIMDDAGSLVTKTWTVQKIDVRLESTFNDKLTYPIGEISFDYTPYGAISKTVHFILDGVEIGTIVTSASGIPMGYTIPSQEHGAHNLDVYMTAVVNNNNIASNHITKDIIWYDATSTIPVIATELQSFTARQYDTTNIVYTVFDPTTETPTVTIAVDDEVITTQTLTTSTVTYSFKSTEVGIHKITITCGETVKTITATIIELGIEIEPVTAGLVFDFNPVGYSNNDADRVWTNGTYSMILSDNFNWTSGGYQLDENGDQYFCIKAGTSATINYELFADDAKKNGKEMKLIFKTTNVQSADASFLTCLDNTTESNHIGIQMNVHEAYIYGQAGNLYLPYSENDIIEFEFNINKNTEAVPEFCGYEDGVSTRHVIYDDSYNFTQNTPKTITLGSDKCDVHIYRMKVYNTSLAARSILNNFIADARNAEEMISRYERNQIYDENGNLNPDVLAEKCPWLRVYKLSAPYFTNNKSDKVPYTTIQQIYKDGDQILDNWICYDCSHSGQGTSSNNYGAAGRNLDFIMNKSQREGVKPYFILGDGKTRTDKITLTRTSVPVDYLNAKVNVASSNMFTNALLAKRYNDFNPYKHPFVRDKGEDTSFIKDTMEFVNAVIFVQETNEDVSTHREFADTDWHFYSLCNIGDSKKTDKTRLTDPTDPYECIIEQMDVELPLSDFPQDTMMNAMGYTENETNGKITYTWAKDENLGILYEQIDGEYVLTQDTTVNLSKTYYVDILEHDDFSEDYTYGWRYIYEDGTDEENADAWSVCHNAWIQAYRFITNSTDEEFKSRFEEYFVKDSILFYYLFTTRYTMVDNRSKNLFHHLGKTGVYRKLTNPVAELLPIYCELVDGAYIATEDTEINTYKTYYTQYAWSLAHAYDMDTACSLNNYGFMQFRYGLEDTDVDDHGKEVFRESDSTFFCRVRDLFSAELKSMYNTLESQNTWHAESFLNEIEAWQNQFPEELWRLDIERKYIRTYNSSFINGKGDPQFLKNMANGKMKYAIKEWERSQEKYIASKYQSSVASSDHAVLRCTVPTGDLVVPVDYRTKLTPYNYMYLNVKYGTGSPIQLRGEPGKEYMIPFTGDSTDIVEIYSASCLQSIGDLSTFYPTTVDTAMASRIKELNIGNSTDGYDNPYLTTVTLGSNCLLEKLNLENVSGYSDALNLSALENLKELYVHGSNISGVTFADGGNIQIAELPAISSISMKNLIYLANLDIVSLDNLTTLTVENCSTVDVKTMLETAPNINRVRITGVDWALEDTSLLDEIYDMAGIDKDGYNITQSVLAGKVHVPVMREKLLADYNTVWSDLEITYDTLINQFTVTFINDNGDTLDIQYVNKGDKPIDPMSREENPIPTPTKESTVSTDFTFSGWDTNFVSVFADQTITATYSESLRKYTVKYISKGTVLQTYTVDYGTTVFYEGDIPTYTTEESAYKYYLFSGWDKSGYVNGEKTINAVYDTCEYELGYFDRKDLSILRPVEIYAMTKLGIETKLVELKDSISFELGCDFSFEDIEESVLISQETEFSGKNYIDTGVQIFDEDRDFVIAVDYSFLSGNSTNAVLAQCYQSNGTNGFRLWYNNEPKLTWGTASTSPSAVNMREIVVIRHVKGEMGLHVYASNLDGDDILYTELSKTKSTSTNATLVFGCSKADDGVYENYAKGIVYWSKIWYADLGDTACKKLASWIHEKRTFEMAGFKRYYLSDNSSKRCSMTFLDSRLLTRNMALNDSSTNTGGWATCKLNSRLNKRLYNAIPDQWRQLIKQVQIASSVGDKSTEISTSDCYIAIPSVVEVEPSMTNEPYVYEGTSIPYLTTNQSRVCTYDNGTAGSYWLRSPNVSYSSYYYMVNSGGALYGYYYAYDTGGGVRIMLSI